MTNKKLRQYAGIDAETRKNERKIKLINAGIECFGTMGYSKSKIKDICQIAGLTERYFYESFKNKAGLLLAVHQYLVEKMDKHVFSVLENKDLKPDEAARTSMYQFLRHFQDDPRRARIQLYEILASEPGLSRHFRTAMMNLTRHIEKVNTRFFGDIIEPTDGHMAAQAMAGAIIEVVRVWALDGFKVSIDDMVSKLMEMHTALGRYFLKI